MNRPLLIPALSFAAGIAVADALGGSVGWLAGAAAGVLLLAAVWRRGRAVALAAGWLVAGWLAFTVQQTPLAPDDLRRLAGREPCLAELRGVITETPTLRLAERQGQLVGRTLVRLDVCAWRTNGGDWQRARGAVMTATEGALPNDLFRRRTAAVSGVLRMPPGPVAPGLFDYREFLRYNATWYLFDVHAAADWQPLGGSAVRPPWSERFLPWAQRALARGLPDDEATRLLWAMTLGWRTALSGEVNTVFMEAGPMHVFAISGLHIALLAGMVVALLRAFRVPRGACGVVAVPVLWFYIAATGWQASAVRSGVMMTAVVGGWALNRPGDLLNSLAFAALVILVLDPGQLFLAGFQLSFGVVAGLALLVPRLEPQFLRWLRFNPDPFLPDELRPRWQRCLERPLRLLALTLATGVAAFLSSLPLTVQYFHLLSPVSLLANIVVVPLSSLALAANLAALAVTPVAPGLAEVFNASAWLWMTAMTSVSRACAEFPGGVWYVAAPAWPWWLAYYAALAAVMTGWALDPARRWLCAAGAALVMVAAGASFWNASRETTLTVLPGGTALVVQARSGAERLVLNPGGPASSGAMVVPFLHAHGWNRVPVLALALADAAHTGGGTNFLSVFRPRELAVANRRLRSPAFRQVLELAAASGIAVREVLAGDRLSGWTVLNPAVANPRQRAEDQALVLAGTPGELRVLLLSDLGRTAQRDLLDRAAGSGALAADIVVTGIPRAGEPLDDALLEAVRPQLIVVASAEFPATEQAKPELRARLGQSGARVLYGQDSGTVTLKFRGGRAEVSAMDGTAFQVSGRPSLARTAAVP